MVRESKLEKKIRKMYESFPKNIHLRMTGDRIIIFKRRDGKLGKWFDIPEETDDLELLFLAKDFDEEWKSRVEEKLEQKYWKAILSRRVHRRGD